MAWLLNAVYAALLMLVSPVVAWRALRHGRYRRGWREKLFGLLPEFRSADCVIWFHAVSVGEILQLTHLINRLQQEQSAGILITTSTDTGFDLACRRFPGCTVSWFPLDFSWAVKRAVRRVRPSQIVLVEMELWPNFLSTCHHRDIPVTLVNARISDRSFRGYSRVRRLIAPLLQPVKVAAQTQSYADRFVALGTDPERTSVTGSIKFDGVETDRSNAATRRLRDEIGFVDDAPVFIAGSTQSPEESAALAAWRTARSEFPHLKLILVPRHKERFDEVAQLLLESGIDFQRRSASPEHQAGNVLLLDTIGELGACWGMADIAFVGGSFGRRGGQNMLEPAAYGAAVMFGPKTQNFREIVSGLLTADAAIELSTPESMADCLLDLLRNVERRRALGDAAQRYVQSHVGAIDRTLELLSPPDRTAQAA